MTVTSGAKTIRIDKSEAYLVPESALDLHDVPDRRCRPEHACGRHARQGGVRYRIRVVAATSISLRWSSPKRQHPHRPQVRDPEAGPGRGAMNIVNKPELAAFLKDNPGARLSVHMAASDRTASESSQRRRDCCAAPIRN